MFRVCGFSGSGKPERLYGEDRRTSFGGDSFDAFDVFGAVNTPDLPGRVGGLESQDFSADGVGGVGSGVVFDGDRAVRAAEDRVRGVGVSDCVGCGFPEIVWDVESVADCCCSCEVPQAGATQVAFGLVQHVKFDVEGCGAVVGAGGNTSFDQYAQACSLLQRNAKALCCLRVTEGVIHFEFQQIFFKEISHTTSLRTSSHSGVPGART